MKLWRRLSVCLSVCVCAARFNMCVFYQNQLYWPNMNTHKEFDYFVPWKLFAGIKHANGSDKLRPFFIKFLRSLYLFIYYDSGQSKTVTWLVSRVIQPPGSNSSWVMYCLLSRCLHQSSLAVLLFGWNNFSPHCDSPKADFFFFFLQSCS